MILKAPKTLLAVAAAILVTATIVFAQLSPGSMAPDFTLKDINGKTVKLSSYRGQVVFLNFFTTWCPGCRDEFPEVVKMSKEYAGKKVRFISIALDDERTVGRVPDFARSHKATHQVLLGKGVMEAAEPYGFKYIPSNFVVGKDGKIVDQWLRYQGVAEDGPKWKAAINKALKK